MTDENKVERDPVDPAEFQTFDHYDPSLDPPEVPDVDEEEEEPAHSFGRSVPAGTVEATVGLLSVAYNRR